MPKTTTHTRFFRPIHLQAVIFLVFYAIFSKTVFIKSVADENIMVSFFVPYIFGIVAGNGFLYLFSHQDFFHFMKEVERIENKNEKKLLNKYKHFGKILTTLIIATVGGPVFSALTIRLLLNNAWYKYLLIIVGNIPSTIFTVSLAKGLMTFAF